MNGSAPLTAHETAAQLMDAAVRKAAAEQASRDRRQTLAERSWMNRAQRRAADRGEATS